VILFDAPKREKIRRNLAMSMKRSEDELRAAFMMVCDA